MVEIADIEVNKRIYSIYKWSIRVSLEVLGFKIIFLLVYFIHVERRALAVRCNMLVRRFASCSEQAKIT